MRHIKTYEVKRENQFYTKFKVGDLVRLTSDEYMPSYWKQNKLNVDILKVITTDPTDTLAYELKVVDQNIVDAYWFEEYKIEKLSDHEIAAMKYNL